MAYTAEVNIETGFESRNGLFWRRGPVILSFDSEPELDNFIKEISRRWYINVKKPAGEKNLDGKGNYDF
jgi:hypothetical protein